MGFNFYMYRGAADIPPFTRWESNLAAPIAPRDDVWSGLSELFPSIKRESEKDGHTFGHGVDARYDCQFQVSTVEIHAGVVVFISTDNRASPSTLSAIMDRFKLNYCCTDFGDFRHPQSCDDDWKPITSP